MLVSRRDLLEPADFEAITAMEGAGVARPAAPVGSMTLDEIERAMIVKSLAHHAGNLTKVAASLG